VLAQHGIKGQGKGDVSISSEVIDDINITLLVICHTCHQVYSFRRAELMRECNVSHWKRKQINDALKGK
jgi:hypothetical protein